MIHNIRWNGENDYINANHEKIWMAYNGKVRNVLINEDFPKRKIELIKVIVWYIGVLISFIPIVIEGLVYLKNHIEIDKQFFMQVCAKGDVLWILATLLVLTLVECCTGTIEIESNVGKWLFMLGTITWGLCFAIWVVFKYIYPTDFSGSVVLWTCGIMGIIVLIVCSVLQLGCTEVEV